MADRAPNRKTSRRKLLRRVFYGSIALAAVDAFAIEPRWLQFHRREIEVDDLPPEFDGYRIGFFADTHIPKAISRPFLQQACRELMRFRPDVILGAGDFVAQKSGNHHVPDLSGFFDDLKAPDGVLGVLGNHDYWVSSTKVRHALAEQTPIEIIDGQHKILERNGAKLCIAGIDDLWSGSSDIDAALTGVDPNIPRILLSHNPDVAEISKAKARVDLMLSGHTHGGQIRIPFGPSIHTPSAFQDKFARGLVQGKRYRVFVTQGLCSVWGIRFCCRPEVCGLVLRRRAI